MPPRGDAVVQAFAATVRADVALEAGQPEQALTALSEVDGEVPLELVSRPAFALVREYGQEHARYLRAEALNALGDPEADRWWRHGFDNAPNEIAYAAPRDLRLAEGAARRGERAAAADRYRRFIEAWSRCDASLRPLREAALTELARLASR